MLERLKLFRNKNKKAGDESKAEQNLQKEETVKQSEETEEKHYQESSNSDNAT